MRKQQRGIAAVVVLIALVVLLGIVSAVSYYLIQNAKKIVVQPKGPFISIQDNPPIVETAEISASDDTKTMEKELNETTLDSVDKDIQDLESSASSL